jgi:hypothetical protein
MHVIGSLAGMFEVILTCSSNFFLINRREVDEVSYIGGSAV